jgi:hypothetical protein
MACSCCSFGDSAEQHFNADKVAKELALYRRKGPGPTTHRLRDGLVSAGLREGTLLDIGGGLGILSLELLDVGFSRAVVVNARPRPWRQPSKRPCTVGALPQWSSCTAISCW